MTSSWHLTEHTLAVMSQVLGVSLRESGPAISCRRRASSSAGESCRLHGLFPL